MKWEAASLFRSKPGHWWKNKSVRLLVTVRTKGGKRFNAGRIATVDRKFGGLTLTGRRMYVTRVPFRKLEVDIASPSQSRDN